MPCNTQEIVVVEPPIILSEISLNIVKVLLVHEVKHILDVTGTLADLVKDGVYRNA